MDFNYLAAGLVLAAGAVLIYVFIWRGPRDGKRKTKERRMRDG